MSKHLKASIVISLLIIFILATPGIQYSKAATNWYVRVNGSDANNCLSPTTPCATINGALTKAAKGDTILVTAETYFGYGPDFLFIDKDIVLSGGWNKDFTQRTGRTILHGQNKQVVLEITQASTVSLEYFIIENGFSNLAAGGISNYGTLNLYMSIVQGNFGSNYGGGITNYGSLTVSWSTIRDNLGPGIYNWDNAQSLTIVNSAIVNNTAGPGVHIYDRTATIVNSTISGNSNDWDGGGIYFGGNTGDVLTLWNVTISGNQAPTHGGGISFDGQLGAQIYIANSILSGNSAPNGPDCWGPIISAGYNILGDVTGCTYISAATDQLNVDPKIAPLGSNGGPTPNHRLYPGSPAIDRANPDGCKDAQGNLLTTDQRGFVRPIDGNGDGTLICDIGAYEYDPSVIIRDIFLPVVQK